MIFAESRNRSGADRFSRVTDRDFFADIVQRLAKGFSADTLDDISRRIAARHQQDRFQYASAALTLQRACATVASLWEDPVTTVEADGIRQAYQGSVQLLARSLSKGEEADIRLAADELAASIL